VVKRYLREKGSIPLSRMSVISYGASVPVHPGGMNNRRIVVHVRVAE
jgi:outer membrane protein OmpA-like peptidoglycan-associated protein